MSTPGDPTRQERALNKTRDQLARLRTTFDVEVMAEFDGGLMMLVRIAPSADSEAGSWLTLLDPHRMRDDIFSQHRFAWLGARLGISGAGTKYLPEARARVD